MESEYTLESGDVLDLSLTGGDGFGEFTDVLVIRVFGNDGIRQRCVANHAASLREHALDQTCIGLAPRDVVFGLLKHASVLRVIGDDDGVVHTCQIHVAHGFANLSLNLHIASCSYNNNGHAFFLPEWM